MLVKKSKKAHKQPVHWRQAISHSKYKKYGWGNWYIYPLTKYTFSYRHYESFLTDVFIIGSNPILTHLLLVKLHKEHLNDFYQHNKKINVTILIDHNADYWSYHTLMQPEYLEQINQKTGLRLKKIEDLFDHYGELYTEHSPLEINIIPNLNMSVYHGYRKPEFVDGYVFMLQDKNTSESDYEGSMPTVVMTENTIKDTYWGYLMHRIRKHGYSVKYPEEKAANEKSKVKTHLLLCRQVLVTSMVSCCNSTSEKANITLGDASFSVTRFSNELSECSYGSAKEVADDFINFKALSLSHVIDLIGVRQSN